MSERRCTVEGCDSRQSARGWCGKHYSRWRRYGNPEEPPRKSGPPRRSPLICVVDECDRPANLPGTARGYCRTHWYRLQTYGDPLAELKQAAPYGDARCLIDDCDREVVARGWCSLHYGRWANHGGPEALADSVTALRETWAREKRTGKRTCRECTKTKPLDQFSRDRSRRDGLRTTCRRCAADNQNARRAEDPERWRKYYRKRYAANPGPGRQYARDYYRANPEKVRGSSLKCLYGITLDDWQAMFDTQGGRCLLCGRPSSSERRLAVDHCHETGRVRGLLCAYCNTSLGFVESRGLNRIAAYLAGELDPQAGGKHAS